MINATSKYARLLWNDRGTVYVMESYRVGNVTKRREVVMHDDIQCKLSLGSTNATNQSRSIDTKTQVVKLFLDKDLLIVAGSKIVVTRKDGKVFAFKNSGEPAVYTDLTSHQEVALDLFEGWA